MPLAVLFFCGPLHVVGQLSEGAEAARRAYPIALAVVAAGFFLASVLYSLFTWRPVLPWPYLWRRGFELGVPRVLWFGVALLALGSVPLVSGWLQGYGVVSLVAGLAGGLGAFSRSGGAARGRIPIGVLAPVASALILYGLALASYGCYGMTPCQHSCVRQHLWPLSAGLRRPSAQEWAAETTNDRRALRRRVTLLFGDYHGFP